MAKVYLRSNKGKMITDLPPVCIKCGAPATLVKSKQFSWQPPWIPVLLLFGLLPYIIVSLILTKRQRVETPLCDPHKSYWWFYPTLLGLSFLGLCGLGFLAMILLGDEHGNGSTLGGILCAGTLISLVVWLIVVAVLNSMRVRPKEITDRFIHLTSVSQEFADAVEEEEERNRREFDRAPDDRERRPPRPQEDDRIREADDDSRYQR